MRTALLEAQLSTRVDLLDRMTVVEDYERRFRHGPSSRELGRRERRRVEKAYEGYLRTIPESKRMGSISYTLKDVVAASGFGIASAGLPAYDLLVEGHTQALGNDIVLSMKQGNVAAPSHVVDDAQAAEFFAHHGHRTAVSQSALQAHADPWLGWTELNGRGYVVAEISPYDADLDWSELSEPEDLQPFVDQLGRATAKVHCVSDKDSGDTPLVDFQTEDAVAEAVGDDVDGFVRDLVEFAHAYADRARADHRLFVAAFREDGIPGSPPRTAEVPACPAGSLRSRPWNRAWRPCSAALSGSSPAGAGRRGRGCGHLGRWPDRRGGVRLLGAVGSGADRDRPGDHAAGAGCRRGPEASNRALPAQRRVAAGSNTCSGSVHIRRPIHRARRTGRLCPRPALGSST